MIILMLITAPLLLELILFLTLGERKLTWKERFSILGIQVIATLVMTAVIYGANTHDVEVWNGVVARKAREEVSCSHSYSCNCVESCSGSGSNESCSTTCQTCYEHPFDVDWALYTSNNEQILIDRLDSQGLMKPARWESARIGEPTAVAHAFTNYIKAAPDTLFRHEGQMDQFKDVLPHYPQGIYDYYRLNRLVQVGVSLPDAAQWNEDLSELNGALGAKKQENAIVVVVKGQPAEFFSALEQKWIGGKKNDAILVVDVDDQLKIQWADVMAWTQDQMFQVKLRDDVVALGVLDRARTVAALRTDIDSLFRRKSMKDFKYLKASITPSPTEWIVCLFLEFAIALGMIYLFETNDFFGDKNSFWTGSGVYTVPPEVKSLRIARIFGAGGSGHKYKKSKGR